MRGAMKGLKMYVGKNQTINMSRHKMVDHILGDWYKEQNIKPIKVKDYAQIRSNRAQANNQGGSSLPNLKVPRNQMATIEHPNNRYIQA